jgi:hypothetical protein
VSLRKPRKTLLLFSLVTILSWLLATNHCAIARELATSIVNDSACPGHEHCPTQGAKPEGKEDRQGRMACCWALKVTLNPAQSLASYDASFFNLEWFVPAFLKLDLGSEVARAWHCDHGPPKVLSFAEQVLQRCLLSNAPPVLS